MHTEVLASEVAGHAPWERCSSLLVDICGTLISDNTTRGYVASLPLSPGRRVLRGVAMSRLAAALDSMFPESLVRASLVLTLRGLSLAWLERQAESYGDVVLRDLAVPAIVCLVQEFRSRGLPVYLASATLSLVAARISGALGCSGFVASRLAVSSGRCAGWLEFDATGRKVEALRRAFPEIRLDEACVVTDNIEDRELLGLSRAGFYLSSGVGACVPGGARCVG